MVTLNGGDRLEGNTKPHRVCWDQLRLLVLQKRQALAHFLP